jgi:hypothetical protein
VQYVFTRRHCARCQLFLPLKHDRSFFVNSRGKTAVARPFTELRASRFDEE